MSSLHNFPFRVIQVFTSTRRQYFNIYKSGDIKSSISQPFANVANVRYVCLLSLSVFWALSTSTVFGDCAVAIVVYMCVGCEWNWLYVLPPTLLRLRLFIQAGARSPQTESPGTTLFIYGLGEMNFSLSSSDFGHHPTIVYMSIVIQQIRKVCSQPLRKW